MEDLQNKTHSDKCTTYEFFILRCFRSKRFDYGANTDTWDTLHSKYLNFLDAKNHNSKRELCDTETEYLQNLNEVKNYLDKAYQKLLDVSSNLNEETLTSLKNYQILIKEPNEPNLIVTILEMSLEIMNKYKLGIMD